MNRTVNKRGKIMLEARDYCLVDDLPENCIYNILGRLPLESLCSSRFVCKTWYGIVNSIDFRNSHLHRSDPATGIIFLTPVQNYSYSPPPKKVFSPKSNSMITDLCSSFHVKFMGIKDGKTTIKEYNTTIRGRIIATCNGLIVFEKKLRAVGFILLNPVTREVEDIPVGTISSMPYDFHGLAFCQASRRYKLLHLFMTKDKLRNLGCEIMDIGSGLWRAVDVPPTERPHFLHSPIFAMGALHWIQYLDGQGDCVVSMPLNDEKFKTMAIPIPAETGGRDHIPFNTVFAMGEFLGFSSRGEAKQIEVWIWRGSDECGWEKQYDIDGSGFGYLTLLYCDGDDQLVFKRVDGCFYAYDRYSQILTKIETINKGDVTGYWTIFPHVNSLLSWRS